MRDTVLPRTVLAGRVRVSQCPELRSRQYGSLSKMLPVRFRPQPSQRSHTVLPWSAYHAHERVRPSDAPNLCRVTNDCPPWRWDNWQRRDSAPTSDTADTRPETATKPGSVGHGDGDPGPGIGVQGSVYMCLYVRFGQEVVLRNATRLYFATHGLPQASESKQHRRREAKDEGARNTQRHISDTTRSSGREREMGP